MGSDRLSLDHEVQASWVPDAVIPGTELLVRHSLGRGGMGRVFAVEHRMLGRWFAVKVLNREFSERADMVERLKLEARALSQLAPHQNLVQVIDLRQAADGRWFMQMELLRGRTLYDFFSYEESFLAPPRAILITHGVLRALDAAHHHPLQLVHRDVKPSNIFLAKSPDGMETPKLLDFGVAKVLQDRPENIQTAPGLAIGTAGYMAPETLEGLRADARADLYSTGVVLYEMLVGRRPFPGSPSWQDLAGLILQGIPEATYAAVPEALRGIVRRATARNRDDRYATAQAFSDDLTAVLARLTATPSLPPSIDLPAATLNAEARPSPGHAAEQPTRSAPDADSRFVDAPSQQATNVFSLYAPTKPGPPPAEATPDHHDDPTDIALPLFVDATVAHPVHHRELPPSYVVGILSPSDDAVYVDPSQEHQLLNDGTIALLRAARLPPKDSPAHRVRDVHDDRPEDLSTRERRFRTAATPPPSVDPAAVRLRVRTAPAPPEGAALPVPSRPRKSPRWRVRPLIISALLALLIAGVIVALVHRHRVTRPSGLGAGGKRLAGSHGDAAFRK